MHCGFPPSLYHMPRGCALTQEYAIRVHLFHHKAAGFPLHSLGPQGYDVTQLWCGAKSPGTGKLGRRGDNHIRDLISETGVMQCLYGIFSCVLIAVDEASWCQTLTKTLCRLSEYPHLAKACSQDEKMYSKKRLHTKTHTHTSCKHGMPP